MSNRQLVWLDPLYGDLRLDNPIASLAAAPLVQRLRHVRLSNVDSLDTPGIANTSRYEHSLGVSWLAGCTGLRAQLDPDDFVVLQAAALVHDSAITPYGHLVEEAYRFTGEYDHEGKLRALLLGDDSDEIGGIDRQLGGGRQTGLTKWAVDTFGVAAGRRRLEEIFELVRGRGPLGPCIAGEMDLDNLDNVVRAAYHMGLECDRRLPVAIAERMRVSNDGARVAFETEAIPAIEQWLTLRRNVYSRFMLGRNDFAGKVMILYSVAAAIQSGEFGSTDWSLTDHEFLTRLGSATPLTRDTLDRWLNMELWSLSDLIWLRGPAPGLTDIYRFNKDISDALGRACFGYRIKDKRTRKITVELLSGGAHVAGSSSALWLYGVATPQRRGFTADENRKVARAACERFGAQVVVESESRHLL